MSQWTGVKPTPEQHRAATLERIADALEHTADVLEGIANRPRFITLENGSLIGIDHIHRITIRTEGWGRLYLSDGSEYDALKPSEVADILNALKPTDGLR